MSRIHLDSPWFKAVSFFLFFFAFYLAGAGLGIYTSRDSLPMPAGGSVSKRKGVLPPEMLLPRNSKTIMPLIWMTPRKKSFT